ncbi:hypothetical protein PQG02_37225 (plasmid) [Nostoc sp. UHCC 0926]|nr:hypothetical protein [Nostoc sp. UHCC 0926]WDD31909.1 hypothetical protein PQG02_25020 [Nostoc sp. UHCC 0926]WDD31978.1 hypothetical protein PQG02_25390 [Nostoc sp. UHCC 0926]WDD32940.1 hypothetical protein PQG02_30840 [Nostoc sp. UHCC 0926]WDD33167.1 hypothetical protein PQG02_01795 [Nostoc sp. UHCC 0926]WDD33827.1 hypothetical protein PQG02_05505 [Nostoc sp. UHCC 0926]
MFQRILLIAANYLSINTEIVLVGLRSLHNQFFGFYYVVQM